MMTNGYPDYPGSYRGIFIKKLCLALKKEGLDIVVLCPKVFMQSPFFEIDDGIPVHRFWYPSRNKPLGQSGRIPVVAMMVYMFTGFIAALNLIFKERPDIIHGNWIVPTGLIASVAGKITGRPVVNSVRGMDFRIGERALIKPLFNLASKLSCKITVVSENMKSNSVLADAEVISSGVDDNFFKVIPDPESKTVISTRSLEPLYDVETLIRAVPHVLEREPGARFIIIGDGSLKNNLINLSKELKVADKITFTGKLPNEQIPNYMKIAKVYVSTSLADGTSVSLLEALAAKLIPVVTNIDANRTLMDSGSMFEKGDPKSLSFAILAALKHIASPDSEGMDNEKVSWLAIAQRYLQLYNILDNKHTNSNCMN